MGKATDRLDFVISGVLRVVYYRSLHIVSVPFSPQDVLEYAQEQGAGGRFGGTVEESRNGPLFTMWLWSDVKMGEGLTMDVWFFGLRGGAQTVLVRKGFWKGNFSKDTVRGATLGLVG